MNTDDAHRYFEFINSQGPIEVDHILINVSVVAREPSRSTGRAAQQQQQKGFVFYQKCYEAGTVMEVVFYRVERGVRPVE